MFYALFLTFMISGTIHEVQLKTFNRFEECFEVATAMMRNREYMSARCVLVENPKEKD